MGHRMVCRLLEGCCRGLCAVSVRCQLVIRSSVPTEIGLNEVNVTLDLRAF
jgi:hypothetical protein